MIMIFVFPEKIDQIYKMYSKIGILAGLCRGGGMVIHEGLKNLWPQGREGSTPSLGTYENSYWSFR